MTDKKIEQIVERKVLEMLGDPDAGLSVKRSFLNKLRKNMTKPQKLTSHADVLKRCGLRRVER